MGEAIFELDCCGQYGWIVALSTVFACVVAYGIGANDVANAFATSVGAKSLTIKQAVAIAAVCEFSGAFFLGAEVANTVRKKIVDFDAFQTDPEIFMIGMMAALLTTACWLIGATAFGMPVSTTHSIIGSVLGFGLAADRSGAINWDKIQDVAMSWIFSPFLSGAAAVILFFSVRTLVLRRQDSTNAALIFYPILVGVAVAINSMYFIYKGAKRLKADQPPYWEGVLWAMGIGAIVGIILKFVFIDRYIKPKLGRRRAARAERKDIEMAEVKHDGPADMRDSDNAGVDQKKLGALVGKINTFLERDTHAVIETDMTVNSIHKNAEVFNEDTEWVFTYLQVFTAIVDSIGHGANDVANSIGPFAAIIAVYNNNEIAKKSDVPGWILAVGGIGIVIGLLTYGYKIIESIGVKLMKVTPSRGFAIELGAAIIIIIGSGYGLPLSTTHCQVGAEVGVSLLEGKGGVNWALLGKVAVGWVATLLICAVGTACVFSILAYSPSLAGYEGTRQWAEMYNINPDLGYRDIDGNWVQN